MAIDVIQLNKTVRNISPRLHSEWWKKLDLENWKDLATTNDLVEQRLDNAILSRFGLEHFWLTEDLEIIQRWLSVINKLPVLLVATGLITQNCPDYIWDSQYREVMQKRFSQTQLEQLIALWPHATHPPQWLPDTMLFKAESYSASALFEYWSGHAFGKILSLSLPVMEIPNKVSQIEVENVINWMFRLEKFL
ncbi:type III secretion system domain-containing protein [Vibrio tetraodonis]|uniref:type III secretion system domain-containing protein n=1 Tax=Vibrio tetraodonis TaxID=2231647 RepID=UPI000E0B9683|nr:type III secretion system domain-containing protein [Vibrio tetraodonis]